MKKSQKQRKNTLLNSVKRSFRVFYSGLEKPFSQSSLRVSKKVKKYNKSREDKIWLREILTTNKIVKRFYKRPEIEVKDIENISSINFKARDGLSISGLVYEPNKNSNKWVIACHWFAGHKTWSIHHAMAFAKMGYNILVFDFRGHGQSENGSTTMGAKEQHDLMGAVDWIKENKKVDKLALMGTSMGAFVINYCSIAYNEEFKKLNLQFLVSDAGYGSVFSLFLHVRNIYLFLLPKRRTKKVINRLIEKHNRQENNLNLHDVSIFKLLEDIDKKTLFPTLFFHSIDDKVTSCSDTYELLLKRNCKEDDYLVFNFSMHTQSIRYHFKTYNYKLAEFINLYEKDEEIFKNLVEEWSLLKFEKKDKISLLLN
ncbi:alpha/beta hydrolase [Spiroplasma endosymbiont of Cantharis rufa]|uniref:alpha/beta hydrolase n=1 Tax=Spiroplasma endosymbiont of Cantharis rufa TaxID=3066279 RepID=UPI0030CEA591